MLVLTSNSLVRRALLESLPSATAPVLPLRGVAANRGLVERWPYNDGAFERVLCVNVIEQTPNTGDFLAEMARVLSADGTAYIVSPFLSRDSDASLQDYAHLSVDGLTASAGSSMRVERSEALGGVGTALGHILHSWATDEGRTRRISPILLELPLLPILLAGRFIFALLGLALVTLLDKLDRTRRFYAHIFVVLKQTSAEKSFTRIPPP